MKTRVKIFIFYVFGALSMSSYSESLHVEIHRHSVVVYGQPKNIDQLISQLVIGNYKHIKLCADYNVPIEKILNVKNAIASIEIEEIYLESSSDCGNQTVNFKN